MSATPSIEQIQQLEARLKPENTGLPPQSPIAATADDVEAGMARAYRDILLRIACGGVVNHGISANEVGPREAASFETHGHGTEDSDLALTFNPTDKVLVWDYPGREGVEPINFADGTIWDYATVTDKAAYVTNPMNEMEADDPLARSAGTGADIFTLEDGEDTSTYLTTEHGGLIIAVHASGEVRIEGSSQTARQDETSLAEGINWDYLTALKRV